MTTYENLLKWQNYAHYLLLTGWVFFTHYLTDIWGIERLVVDGVAGAWIYLFLFYALFIFIGDTIIHIIFAVLPEPLKWAD